MCIALDLARKGACTLFPSVAADFSQQPDADQPASLPQSKLYNQGQIGDPSTYLSLLGGLSSPASSTLLQQHQAALSPQDQIISEIKDFWFRTSEAVLIKVDDGIVGLTRAVNDGYFAIVHMQTTNQKKFPALTEPQLPYKELVPYTGPTRSTITVHYKQLITAIDDSIIRPYLSNATFWYQASWEVAYAAAITCVFYAPSETWQLVVPYLATLKNYGTQGLDVFKELPLKSKIFALSAAWHRV